MAHGYDVIRTERVVAIIERWLPSLIADTLALLPEAGP
ncbi:MAG: hypothetical protein HYR64_00935 [Fimbriimonas ginsengisoli]|uniref:Uncharacterized protein n=1 Tax=Fimbriimonas ginsengisoli TaxID=1005039 RepID=A0A931PVJ9_FIMGI|nr:hypothetical protein [Fimbriimonas ginsengisoli]